MELCPCRLQCIGFSIVLCIYCTDDITNFDATNILTENETMGNKNKMTQKTIVIEQR